MITDVAGMVGEVPDIPKSFTALAEWLACVVYLLACTRTRPKLRQYTVLLCGLVALIITQYLIGVVPLWLWIPGMIVAVCIMYGIIRRYRRDQPVNRATSAYWLIRAFAYAEFAAALEWQLYVFSVRNVGMPGKSWFSALFFIVVYAVLFTFAFALEMRHDDSVLAVTSRELVVPSIIVVSSFTMSNLSYVTSDTPFSSSLASEAFNIRTLVCLGGVAFLYAYHVQLNEAHAQAELSAIRNVLAMQYAQYQQSKDSIELINRKYHDLKQQIAVLRAESDPSVRETYLDELEQGIGEYGAQFKTGNSVLDTVLTSKSSDCSRYGIELTCVVDGSLIAGVSAMDLCTIFGNAIDNAIEYERKIPDQQQRMIRVTLTQLNDFVVIRVENYLLPRDRDHRQTQQSLQANTSLPSTTKKDQRFHGFGLKSIRHCAQHYGGDMSIRRCDEWFELTVLLPQPITAADVN